MSDHPTPQLESPVEAMLRGRDHLSANEPVSETLALDPVIGFKHNQPDLAARAERPTQRPGDFREAMAQKEFVVWHLPEADRPVADRLVRFVKTVLFQRRNCVAFRKGNSPAPN